MKIFYLCNPAAHGGKGKKYFELIKNKFDEHKIEHYSIQSEYAGHAIEVIKNLDFGEYDGIVVSGGDGTLFEAVNGYFANNSKKRIPLGVVPIGRGNAFARDLDLHPEKWEEAIEAVAGGKRKKVDVGFCRAGNESFYFINILGLGFVTDVAQTAFKLRALGHLSYIIGVLYRTVFLKAYSASFETDGKKFEYENVFVEISNSRYTGKDFLMAPGAEIDDGKLDVTSLKKLSRLKLLECLPKIFTGEHVKMKEVDSFKAEKIYISTSPVKLLTPDGQLTGTTPITVECIPGAIEVFVK